jgi:hypothetical protein
VISRVWWIFTNIHQFIPDCSKERKNSKLAVKRQNNSIYARFVIWRV